MAELTSKQNKQTKKKKKKKIENHRGAIAPGVAILDFGDRVAFETVQLNIRMQ